MPALPEFRFRLGDRVVDCTRRALVMGDLPAGGLEDVMRTADSFVAAGADVLAVGERHDPVGVVAALASRFDVAIACDAPETQLLEAACAAGAVVAVDEAGTAGPDWFAGAQRHDVSVVTPDPQRAEAAGIVRDRIATVRPLTALGCGDRVVALSVAGPGPRAEALAAVAYGVAHGCRLVRVRDVAGAVAVCRTVEAIMVAR